MNWRLLILSLCFILMDLVQDVHLLPTSQEYLNENGMIATIDGYVPRCPGCVLFKTDDLLIYGTMHVPKERLYLLNTGRFYVERCGYPEDDKCSEYKRDWYLCAYFDEFSRGCNATRRKYNQDCWCDDSTPKRWYALIRSHWFKREDTAFRFVFDPAPRIDTHADRAPFERNNSLFIPELIERGHIVLRRPPVFGIFKSTSGSGFLSPDVLLEMMLLTLAFCAVRLP
ncbi:uncharacterized protein LOC131938700 isoform X2 [Physella acuta]|uniref:uncharacterized protein LOC131938700 isoform X2 n=1 Tax=Physella acuta TaxID=109671 RepID=UPI0027DBCC60|nr:uncharacterized protein LOC131938700 isoform X2 [Physella acuta]